jgi:hypothetical protein
LVCWKFNSIVWPGSKFDSLVNTDAARGEAIWNVAVVPCGALGLVAVNVPQLLTDCPSQSDVPSQVAVCVIDWLGLRVSVVGA